MIIQHLLYWEHDGIKDYRDNIEAYACYLNPQMQRWLRQDYEAKLADHQLLSRTRTVSLVGAYHANPVTELGNGVWQVWLDIKIRDHINGHLAKTAAVRFPLIMSVDSRSCNPLGIESNDA